MFKENWKCLTNPCRKTRHRYPMFSSGSNTWTSWGDSAAIGVDVNNTARPLGPNAGWRISYTVYVCTPKICILYYIYISYLLKMVYSKKENSSSNQQFSEDRLVFREVYVFSNVVWMRQVKKTKNSFNVNIIFVRMSRLLTTNNKLKQLTTLNQGH